MSNKRPLLRDSAPRVLRMTTWVGAASRVEASTSSLPSCHPREGGDPVTTDLGGKFRDAAAYWVLDLRFASSGMTNRETSGDIQLVKQAPGGSRRQDTTDGQGGGRAGARQSGDRKHVVLGGARHAACCNLSSCCCATCSATASSSWTRVCSIFMRPSSCSAPDTRFWSMPMSASISSMPRQTSAPRRGSIFSDMCSCWHRPSSF